MAKSLIYYTQTTSLHSLSLTSHLTLHSLPHYASLIFFTHLLLLHYASSLSRSRLQVQRMETPLDSPIESPQPERVHQLTSSDEDDGDSVNETASKEPNGSDATKTKPNLSGRNFSSSRGHTKRCTNKKWSKKWKCKLLALYNEYATSTPSSSASRTCPAVKVDKYSDTYMETLMSSASANSGKSELQLYLEEKKLPRTCELNVLEHGKGLKGRYSIAARMARDILAIPISIVALESAFSNGGRVLDAYRSTLSPSTTETLICLRGWVFQKDSIDCDMEQLCEQVLTMSVQEDDATEAVGSQNSALA